MKVRYWVLALALSAGALAQQAQAGDRPAKGAAAEDADDTGRNVRDREGRTLTPFDQSESEGDRRLTQKIRQAVVADDTLSTNAQNVKIISIDGVVTLRGPVASVDEKDEIEKKAEQIAGSGKVKNQLEVTSN